VKKAEKVESEARSLRPSKARRTQTALRSRRTNLQRGRKNGLFGPLATLGASGMTSWEKARIYAEAAEVAEKNKESTEKRR
jgi:hypothetical protein